MARLQVHAGDGFEVTYDPAVCGHAGECTRGLPEVFDPEAKPWIRPERAAAARIAEVVARCPKGRRVQGVAAGAPAEAALTAATIRGSPPAPW